MINEFFVKFYPYQADFSNRPQLLQFVKTVTTDFPKIDILINNAGTIQRAPAAEHPDGYWDRVLAINLDAPFILARQALKI